MIVLEIMRLLKEKNQNLSVAESCTGGALSHEITKISGISLVFLGSITAYSNDSKNKILNIPKNILEKHGAVSEPTALKMAENCSSLFSSTWALSTTGIAGPEGGTLSKPVGLVFIGIYGPACAYAKEFIFTGNRLEHRQKTVQEALSILLHELRSIS
jgi:PncC family amidohydrolase